MASPIPFIDPESGGLDTDQLLQETYRLVGLIGFVVGVALIPYLIRFLLGGHVIPEVLVVVVTQFILAVGAGFVLIYVVARGNQLAET